MYPASPLTGTAGQADEVAVGAASAQFANITAMKPGQFFILVANVDFWYMQGANPTATTAPGSGFWPAKTPLFISGANGAKLAVIQDSTGGKASLTQVQL